MYYGWPERILNFEEFYDEMIFLGGGLLGSHYINYKRVNILNPQQAYIELKSRGQVKRCGWGYRVRLRRSPKRRAFMPVSAW